MRQDSYSSDPRESVRHNFFSGSISAEDLARQVPVNQNYAGFVNTDNLARQDFNVTQVGGVSLTGDVSGVAPLTTAGGNTIRELNELMAAGMGLLTGGGSAGMGVSIPGAYPGQLSVSPHVWTSDNTSMRMNTIPATTMISDPRAEEIKELQRQFAEFSTVISELREENEQLKEQLVVQKRASGVRDLSM